MSIYAVFLLILGIIYGSLTILTSVLQLKNTKLSLWSKLLMITGGLLIAAVVSLNHFIGGSTVFLLILGLLSVHAAAVSNGLKLFGKINLSHHVVRLFISVVLIILYEIK